MVYLVKYPANLAFVGVSFNAAMDRLPSGYTCLMRSYCAAFRSRHPGMTIQHSWDRTQHNYTVLA